MGADHDDGTLAGGRDQLLNNPVGLAVILKRAGFVGQDEAWASHQGPGKGQALPLTTGQGVGRQGRQFR